jgi:uncharacterized protein with HEPN domain
LSLLTGAMLGILEESAVAVMVLTEATEAEEFFASRITQQEVRRYMLRMAQTASNLPAEAKQSMAEIDWAGWSLLLLQLQENGGAERDALWFGVRSLVPATLMWLRLFRKSAPQLFSLS